MQPADPLGETLDVDSDEVWETSAPRHPSGCSGCASFDGAGLREIVAAFDRLHAAIDVDSMGAFPTMVEVPNSDRR